MVELKFKVVFRNQTKKNIAETVSNIKAFFEKQRYNFSCGKAKLFIQDSVFQEQVYEVIVCVHVKDGRGGKTLTKICQSWCNWQSEKGHMPYQWLIPMNKQYLESKKPYHHDRETVEFAFGTLPDMSHFCQHYRYESSSDMKCSFYHNKKRFELFLSIDHNQNCNKGQLPQKFVFNYDSISRVLINDQKKEKYIEIFFQLYHFPFIYVEKVDPNLNIATNGSSLHRCVLTASEQEFGGKKWERTLDFGCKCKQSNCDIKKIGRCLVFKLKAKLRGEHVVQNVIERLMQRCPSNTDFCYSVIQTSVSLAENVQRFQELEKFSFCEQLSSDEESIFGIQYAWTSVIKSKFEFCDQFALMHSENSVLKVNHWSFLKGKLLNYARTNAQSLTNALFHINEMISRNVIFTWLTALDKLFDHYCQSEQKVSLPLGMCLVRRIVITPSRIIQFPPAESFDNRIIRESKFGTEYMMRVSIQDDNFSKLTFAVQYHSQKEIFMERVVGNVLRRGFQVGNRHYEYLAASNSQLREHGLWLYARDPEGKTAGDIQKWMGDFSEIKNVAKYMARMGQCFSTSDEAIQVVLDDEKEVFEIPDIKTEDGEYTFSDGIGQISSEVVDEIQNAKESLLKSDQPRTRYKPSAYQIRYKGCKGMVCVDPLLPGRYLAYRPSMRKFQCTTANKLEIVKISAPRPLYLNRPLITILEQLGIDKKVFLDLQKKMILDLTDSLIYEEKAAEMLSTHLSLDIPFKKLQQSAIYLTEEPFFRSLLIAVYKSSVDKLRTKARIAIPYTNGRNMLGVLDETGTLKYGQVFVQYSEELGLNDSTTHILKETVVVTKNPCMHPGDVKKLEAVDIIGLHHIKDCIVFPSQGPRPHPDEMAGSDLDGDEYVVIWGGGGNQNMKKLIFPGENYEPMKYPAIAGQKEQDKIDVNRMVDFMCRYIQNDNIGSFAHAHLAWADTLGIFSQKCMNIAKKYPFVLDFAKTGQTEYLRKEDKPLSYPDFMEKGGHHNSYRSEKTLGYLYRFVRSLSACVNKAGIPSTVKCDSSLEYQGWEKYADYANDLRTTYTERVTTILNKYGIRTESEALSGYVENVSKHYQNRQEMGDAVLIVKSYLISTMSKYRYMFIRDVENEKIEKHLSEEESCKRKYQRASAWYMVTYNQYVDESPSSSPVLSFPWIIADVLIEVHEANLNREQYPPMYVPSTLLNMLDNLLINSFVAAFNTTESCPCMTITENVIREWMVGSHLSLSMLASKQTCFQCFNRVLQYFIQHSGIKCCSWSNDGCLCSYCCSPSVVIIEFLKFYLSRITDLGKCSEGCNGFQNFNLQTVALQTFVSLAVTRNNKCLALSLDETTETDNWNSIQEGDPMRISLVSGLDDLIRNDMNNVKAILISLSGVQDIQISVENEKNDQHYMLMSSTGTSSQRWYLEDLMMNPDIINLLKSKLNSAAEEN